MKAIHFAFFFWWKERFYLYGCVALLFCHSRLIHYHTSFYSQLTCLYACFCVFTVATTGVGSGATLKEIIIVRFEVFVAVSLRSVAVTMWLCFSMFWRNIMPWCFGDPSVLKIKMLCSLKCQETLCCHHSVTFQKPSIFRSSSFHRRLFSCSCFYSASLHVNRISVICLSHCVVIYN